MGRSVKVTFGCYIDGSYFAWEKRHGRPTQANLEKYVTAYAKSLELGGVNDHISKRLGYVPYPKEAKLIREATGEEMATWKSAPFQVF